MKYISLFLIALLFLSCGGSQVDTRPSESSYYLSYDDTSTQISGEVTFDMGNIPNNHTIILSNFTPMVAGCVVDMAGSSIIPSSLQFTTLASKQAASVLVKLASTCTTQELQLRADYVDTSVIDEQVITSRDELTFTFAVDKAQSSNAYTLGLANSRLEITQNLQNESIVVSVLDQLNRPAEDGTVSIVYPSTTGVGSFAKTTLSVSAGEAIFAYTAPNDLASLVENNITGASFKFYYNDNISNFVELQVAFTPDTNQTVIRSYDISFIPQDSSYKMSLEESKAFSISLIDDTNSAVTPSDIRDLNVSLENSYIAELINSNGDRGTSFHFSNINNTTLTLQSGTHSGIVPIHVSALFTDVNGDTKLLEKTFNIIVESGPPTAISISYSGTEQDTIRAKFIEHFAVSVTDKYFNPVNTNPQVSVGAIVGYAKYADDNSSANTNKRIYVDSGTLATLDGDRLLLNRDLIEANSTIDLDNDILVTFGNGYTYPASGEWSMEGKYSNYIALSTGQYDGNKTLNLGYAIGRNHRQDACTFGDEWLGQAKLQSDTATIDDTGTAIIDFSYDYYLTGKDIVLYINIIGQDNALNKTIKIGEATKHTLRGGGIEARDITTITAEDGKTESKRIYMWIKGTNTPYRNANFVISSISSGNGSSTCDGVIPRTNYNDMTACTYQNGQAYVECNVTAAALDSYSISLENPYITNEF